MTGFERGHYLSVCEVSHSERWVRDPKTLKEGMAGHLGHPNLRSTGLG